MPVTDSAAEKRLEPLVLVDTVGLTEEEWLSYRRRGIGGSDVAALLGISPWRTARDLYYDKLNVASVEDEESNWVALEMGHLLEPLVAKIFERKTGYKIYQIKKMFQHSKHLWMLADVDYFVELPDGTTAILEIKTTNYNARDNWWLDGEETVPIYYESQGRHYMAVMDVNRCFFCCLYGNNEDETIIREIRRDIAYEEEMVYLEQYFWENHVLTKTPPPYTEDGDLVVESVRRHTGTADRDAAVVTLDFSLTAKLMRYLQLQEEKKRAEAGSKEIEADMQRLKAALIAEMGQSCKAVCQQDGINYTVTDSNLNHTGIYLYSKGKIMIHLTFDYKTDEKCTTPGQYLKYHRTFQGLTTRELAEKVGIVPATLVLYENDRHPIKHDIAVALANTLGIDRNRLLDEYTTFVDYPYSSLLKKVRHELSLTQMQMAEVIGIGQTTYSGWEREARVPRRKEHDKILAALKKLKVNVDTYLCHPAST